MNADSHKEKLLSRASRGDAAALEQLILAEWPRLLSFIRRELPAAVAALIEPDDVLQDVLFRAFRHHLELDVSREDAVFRWLSSIARNRIIDLVRSQQQLKRGGGWTRLEPNQLTDEGSVVFVLDEIAQYRRTPSASAAQHEMVLLVESAMDELSADHKRVLDLRYLQQKSVAEVAQILDRSEDATKMVCSRALEKLRALLLRRADGV